MNQSVFRSYDIRGRYPDELDEGAAKEIAASLAGHFKSGKIVIAHDARLSSPGLYRAILDTFTTRDMRFKIHDVGLATTPMFYFLVNNLEAVGGIMVTASHNPKEYNGLKIVGPGAAVLSGKEVWTI